MMRWLVLAIGACHASGTFMAGDSMMPSYEVGAPLETYVRKALPGDVVVFRVPEAPDNRYFKRVIGVEGDIVSVTGEDVVVNGNPIVRCRVGGWSYVDPDGKKHDGMIWTEALGGARWLVFHDTAGVHQPPSGTWTVAPGEVFVLGDNRENSFDSRMWKNGSGLSTSNILGLTKSTPRLPESAAALAPALSHCLAR